MEREVKICSLNGQPDSECDCYACRLQRMVIWNNGLREQITELVDAVTEMRRDQQEYFTTRSASALLRAKCSESKVDALLRKLIEMPWL